MCIDLLYTTDEDLNMPAERKCALERVESVDESSYARTVMIAAAEGSIASGWIRVKDEPRCDRAWPSASTIHSLANIEDAFGELGLIKTRSRTIAALAKRCHPWRSYAVLALWNSLS